MSVLSPVALFVLGAITTALLAALVYFTVRGLTARPNPEAPLEDQLDRAGVDSTRPLKVLLAVDGSPCSLAALAETASCAYPPGSAIEVLTVIHSRIPVAPSFPPWALTPLAAHADSVRKQWQHAPELVTAAEKRLQSQLPEIQVTTSVLEGTPKDVILHEAARLGADRIVLGSHGHGRLGRAVLGSTAAAVAADATCSVCIVRPHGAQ